MDHQWETLTVTPSIVGRNRKGEFIILDNGEGQSATGCSTCGLVLDQAWGAPCLAVAEEGVGNTREEEA